MHKNISPPAFDISLSVVCHNGLCVYAITACHDGKRKTFNWPCARNVCVALIRVEFRRRFVENTDKLLTIWKCGFGDTTIAFQLYFWFDSAQKFCVENVGFSIDGSCTRRGLYETDLLCRVSFRENGIIKKRKTSIVVLCDYSEYSAVLIIIAKRVDCKYNRNHISRFDSA